MSNIETPRDAVDPDAVDHEEVEPSRQIGDDVPEADALEQHADVRTDDDEWRASVELPFEADPADVEEQLRPVPLGDDDDLR